MAMGLTVLVVLLAILSLIILINWRSADNRLSPTPLPPYVQTVEYYDAR